MIPVIDGIIDLVKEGLTLIPDPNKKADLLAKIEEQRQQAELQMAQMQADINKAEASNASLFVAGWRPFVGWVCAAGVAWAFVIQPFFDWVWFATGHTGVSPHLDSSTLLTLLLGMLGMGGLRSFDKSQGTASK
jgi:hypothetical protein